jgi:hypothetical protein
MKYSKIIPNARDKALESNAFCEYTLAELAGDDFWSEYLHRLKQTKLVIQIHMQNSHRLSFLISIGMSGMLLSV